MRTDLSVMRDFAKVMRELDDEMPVQYLETLLVVALKPGLNTVQIGEEIRLSTATASRIIANVLMARHGLVKQTEADEDRRQKLIFLTDKGERFLKRLSEVLGLMRR